MKARIRYAAMFALSYTCGLIVIPIAVAVHVVDGGWLNPHPFRQIAANARRHAEEAAR